MSDDFRSANSRINQRQRERTNTLPGQPKVERATSEPFLESLLPGGFLSTLQPLRVLNETTYQSRLVRHLQHLIFVVSDFTIHNVGGCGRLSRLHQLPPVRAKSGAGVERRSTQDSRRLGHRKVTTLVGARREGAAITRISQACPHFGH